MPTSYSRASQGRARASLSSTMTEYGKLVITRTVVTNAGGTVELAFQNPLAWLAYHAENSQDFSDYLREALVRSPPSPICPWNIVLYQDGVDPSDGLSKNHSRKSMVFYWSFLELGMEALSKEEMWGVPCIIRSHLVNDLPGKHVQVTALVLETFFDPDGHDLLRVGMSIKLGEERFHIFAKIGTLLADEPALKEMLACKGHAGTKPCLLCLNAVQHRSGYHEGSDYAVSIAECDFGKFKKHTDATLHRMIQQLHGYKAMEVYVCI